MTRTNGKLWAGNSTKKGVTSINGMGTTAGMMPLKTAFFPDFSKTLWKITARAIDEKEIASNSSTTPKVIGLTKAE